MPTERTHDWRPYRALQQALLVDSFVVLGKAPLIAQRPTDKRKRLHFCEGQAFLLAVRWLLSPRNDHPLDYITICESFDFDARLGPAAVKRIIAHRRQLAAQICHDPQEQKRIVWRVTDGQYWTLKIKPPWMRTMKSEFERTTL